MVGESTPLSQNFSLVGGVEVVIKSLVLQFIPTELRYILQENGFGFKKNKSIFLFDNYLCTVFVYICRFNLFLPSQCLKMQIFSIISKTQDAAIKAAFIFTI